MTEESFPDLVAAAVTFRSCTPVRVTAAYAARGASLDTGAATDPAEAEARLEAEDPFLLPLGAGSGLRLVAEDPNRGGTGITIYIYRRPPQSPMRARPGTSAAGSTRSVLPDGPAGARLAPRRL
ncbi:MAG: hypothetical protein OXI83_02585 [Gemmatimonadota bacterium]|nr:hypothetical protein [Gemmatimonadota bacterium]